MSDDIRVVFGDAEYISARIPGDEDFSASIDAPVVIAGEEYRGEYSFIPNFEGQTVECRGMRMRDNVTIDPIHVYEAANPSGGNTLSI